MKKLICTVCLSIGIVFGHNFAHAQLPNVTATALAFSPASVTAGDAIDLSGTVTNNGNASTGANVKINFFLSTSPSEIQFSFILHSFNLSSLAGGQSRNFNETGEVPAHTTAGSYYVWISIDPEDFIAESNESDNQSPTASRVQVISLNRSPVVANAISDQTLTVGGASFSRDLNTPTPVFTDPDGDALIYTASSSAPGVAETNLAGNTLTVAPMSGGNATITVTANDGKGGTVSTNFAVAVNRVPVVANSISNQTLTIGGASFTRDLNVSPSVFNDPDGDALTYTASSSAPNIATTGISGSILTVAPASNGTATITITANDGNGGTVSTAFMMTVNRTPGVASSVPNQTLTVGGASFTRNLNAAPAVFNDPDGDVLSYTASSNATNIATANLSGSTLTVAPVAVGSATITITANDGKGGTISTTFTATVVTGNRLPTVANIISNQTLTIGGASFTRDLNVSPAVFNDPDGDVLLYTTSSNAPGVAAASLSGNTLTVAPVAVGMATITVTADDGKSGSTSTTFTTTVGTAPNRAPIIANAIFDQTLTVGGASFTRDLNAAPAVFNDPDGDVLTYTTSSSAPGIAAASLSGSTLTVAPVSGGIATITVAANDGRGGNVSTTFTVNLNLVPAIANTISNQILIVGRTSFTRDLNASPKIFSDPDGDVLAYTVNSSAPGVAAANLSGSVLSVAPVNSGNATITVTANDGKGGAVSTTFNVTVNQVPVVANPISDQTLTVGGAAFTRNLNVLPSLFTDPDGDALNYTASSSEPGIATASLFSSTLTVAPVSGGSATITVTANDGKGGSVSTTFNVAVNRVPVVANSISNQTLTIGGAPFARDLNAAPAIFIDPDGEALTYTASSSMPGVATTGISGSTLTVTPVSSGTVTITLTANDGKGGTVSTTFTVTVVIGNRPPTVANAISNQTLTVGGSSFTRDLNAAPIVFNDPDGDVLIYTASSNVTNIVMASLSGSTFTVVPVAVGSATITVTANDGKGGLTSTTFGVTVNSPSGDQSAPQITHAPVATAIAGQSQSIAAAITDNVGVLSVMLFYRVGGASAYDSTAMRNIGANNYEGAIPAGFVNERGVEYYFSAHDGAKNRSTFPTTMPQTNPQVIQVLSGNLTFPRTTPARAYRMISVSIDLTDKSPSSVLGDNLGNYDDTQWRLLRYNNGTNVEFGNPGFANFEPGAGFWLITRESKSLDTGAGKSVKTAQNFVITLPPGWSQIGNPFAFPVNWSQVIKSAEVENRLVGYQGALNEATGYDYTRTQLMPFEGYFVNNRGSSPTTLAIPPQVAVSDPLAKKTTTVLAQKIFTGNEWALQITAACDRYLDKDNYLGGLNDAADQWDDNDFSEAPFFDQHISLYFPHPEWEKFPGLYTGDFRAVKMTGDYWDFRVQTNVSRSEVVSSEVVLRLADIKNLPVDWKIMLLDKTSRWPLDFRMQDEYKFLSGAGETVHDFRLVVGSQNFVESNDLGLAGVPENFVLEQNFPNPFWSETTSRFAGNPETAIRFGLPQKSVVTIKIFDLTGHEVATLLDRAELPAGRHQRVWDGRDALGRMAPSGVYFYRLLAGSFSKTMKLILVR
jgi:hypothetical protein